jgi:hypothetical protein
MCTVIRSRGIVRPTEALEITCGKSGCVGAYVESFTLVLEEHVCSSLATPCSCGPALHTQRNHAERGCRAASSVSERHGEGTGGDAWMDEKVADWSSLVKAAQASRMTVAAAAKPRPEAASVAARHATPPVRQSRSLQHHQTHKVLVNMADATKYYELYRRSRYCMRLLGSGLECSG